MSIPIIKAEQLSKRYLLSTKKNEPYMALRDIITEKCESAGRKLLHPFSHKNSLGFGNKEEFWALQNISFEIQKGDRVGIIGRNGAGKSTLLKILSRITEPTRGRVELNGRVASLLEVGTGFHPELTGRENIFLNGAIMGMARAEIRSKFDEIVAFAEVDKFLDTPVKRYSSGMYVRLAFAVAAHLEPEILVVDEVLAVGDAQFQKKCLGKMEEVSEKGRTVLFVSHNMGAIARLCSQCLWLSSGSLLEIGNSSEVIRNYICDGSSDTSEKIWDTGEEPGDNCIKLKKVRIFQDPDGSSASMEISKLTIIEVEIDVLLELPELTLSLKITNLDGQTILHSANVTNNETFAPTRGKWYVRCSLPRFLFNLGTYALSLSADIPHQRILFQEENLLTWKFETASAEMGRYGQDEWKGIIGPAICQWSQGQLS
jgi:lipopolysaccharide transport system ATP-binding protein